MPENSMQLKKVHLLALKPSAPFNFDATFHKPDHFTSGDNSWQPGIRWQTWNWQGRPLGLKFVDQGSLTEPQIQVDVFCHEKLEQKFLNTLAAEISYRFNLDLDLSGFYRQFQGDEVLGPIMERWRGMRPGHPSSLYEYLIIGIVLQNATVRRSMQMFQALLEKYGQMLSYDGQRLLCFWEPGGLQAVTEDEVRALKVGYRAKSIKRIDDYFAKQEIDEFELRHADLERQKSELLKLYGVGPATVWYILFDVFHQWHFFDHISPWEQKIYSKLFFDQDPEDPVPVEQILSYFERYGPYKQLAVHYIWEDLWWKRKNENIPWLEKQIRV